MAPADGAPPSVPSRHPGNEVLLWQHNAAFMLHHEYCICHFQTRKYWYHQHPSSNCDGELQVFHEGCEKINLVIDSAEVPQICSLSPRESKRERVTVLSLLPTYRFDMGCPFHSLR